MRVGSLPYLCLQQTQKASARPENKTKQNPAKIIFCPLQHIRTSRPEEYKVLFPCYSQEVKTPHQFTRHGLVTILCRFRWHHRYQEFRNTQTQRDGECSVRPRFLMSPIMLAVEDLQCNTCSVNRLLLQRFSIHYWQKCLGFYNIRFKNRYRRIR